MLEVKVQFSNLELIERLRRAVSGIGAEAARRWAPRFEAVLKSSAPRRTGKLQRMLRVEAVGDVVTVGGPDYLAYLVKGVKPHMIYPRKASVLRFEVKGEVVYTKRVSHPGFPPQPFFTRSLDMSLRLLPEMIMEVLENA